MGTLLRTMLFLGPILALIFYFTVAQQIKADTETKENTALERIWNEFKASFAMTPEKRAKLEEKTKQIEKKLERLKEKRLEKEKKAEELKKELKERLRRAIEELKKEKDSPAQ